ncbi:MAG: helix-turn-helix transcriptional regulator [Acidobacteriota bacterium]
MKQQIRPEQIKLLRERLGLTQEQLAHELGVTFYSVNRWENGAVKPSPLAVSAIRNFAIAHGVNVDTIGPVVKMPRARRK